ncbi:MAG: hypothetical protein FGM13_08625 [Dechloromonas sp.]|nr:hypothetical protein [Dechloromonas sp.]
MKHRLFLTTGLSLVSTSIFPIFLYGCKPSMNDENEARKFYSLDSQKVMLKHMASKLSDQELRELWARAEAERSAEIENYEKERNQYYDKREKTLADCEDMAFKTKNPEKCSNAAVVPIGWLLGPTVNSQQDIFNGYVLGGCNWVGVKKAQEIGCFPKGYIPTFVTLEELEASKLTQ